MRVAALYDIHGNLPGLEAVLAEVEREGIDAIVFGGDIASGPPQPREVVELVRSLPNGHCIRGNADRLLDPEFAAWNRFRVGAWPTIVLIDRRGRVRAVHVGDHSGPAIERDLAVLLREG